VTDPGWLKEDDGLPQAGDRLGEHELVERLGRGSMGEVWRAVGPDGTVALKIPLRPAFLRHLRKEGLLLAHVDHPNVARVLHAELQAERPYLVTELIQGKPLRALCTGTLPPAAVILICDQILAGLQAIHDAGILHLDLKPENVIVPDQDQDDVERVKIVDLGLGRATTRLMEEVYLSVSLASRVPAVAGTLAYMSPEQRKGKDLDPRADLFAFGILLHELLTGVLPEPGVPITDLRPELAPRWDVLVSRLTHPDRERRPQDANEARHLVAFTLAEKMRVRAPKGGLKPRDLLTLDEESFTQASPYEPGMVIGEGYELVSLLGRGGFGEVWRVVRSEEELALKLILGPEAKVGLEREVEVAKRIEHRGIPAVRGDHSQDEPPHVVFDLVRGRSLRLILHEEEQLSLDRALAIFDGMLELVEACHGAAVIHMDLKPEHFLVDEDGDAPAVSLIDFGLAALTPRESVAGSLSSRVDARGTLDYMAPEQRDGTVTPAVDTYALGLCLFELLTLHLPKGPQRLRTLRRDVPREVDRLAHAMVQSAPQRRPRLADARAVVATARQQAARRGRRAVAREVTIDLFQHLAHLWRSIPIRLRLLGVVCGMLGLVLGLVLLPEAIWRQRAAAFTPSHVNAYGHLSYQPDAATVREGLPRAHGKVLVIEAPVPGHLTGGMSLPPRLSRQWARLDDAVRADTPGEVRTVVSVLRVGRKLVISVYDIREARLLARWEAHGWPEFVIPGHGRTTIVELVEAMAR
jgi:serine/threonine protein kinase